MLIDGIVLGDHTVVIDGAKALTSAIHTVFGTLGAIQRCQRHKRRNILGHLPDHLHANVTAVLREAWAAVAVALAHRQLERLAASLETDPSGAAASVREGLADTLTLQRFGIAGVLYTKLRTTNASENFNGAITTYSRNVKRWRSGTMVVRWVSAPLSRRRRSSAACTDGKTSRRSSRPSVIWKPRKGRPPSGSHRITAEAAAREDQQRAGQSLSYAGGR